MRARGTRRGPWWLPGMEARRLLPEMEEERLPERCRLALLSAPRLAGRAGAAKSQRPLVLKALNREAFLWGGMDFGPELGSEWRRAVKCVLASHSIRLLAPSMDSRLSVAPLPIPTRTS